MRKLILLFLISFTSVSFSQLVLEENFNYTAGDSLSAPKGWIHFSGNANPILVVAPGLTYPGYPSVSGNAAKIGNNGNDYYKAFNGDSTGSLYVSFLIYVDNPATGDYFLALLPSTSTTNYTARVYAKDSAGGVSFGISKSAVSQGPIVYSAPVYQQETTYLLIVRYRFNTGSTTDDDASLFVFTSPNLPATEPTTPTIGPVTSTANDAPNLSRVALRQGSTASSPEVIIDGIRVFNSWSELVSVKKISESMPEGFVLKQNYPNPFNPVTTIEFSIPEKSYVTLKVYDLLGKEVTELVKEELNVGSYNVTFNSANLTSGVYFYKLTANNYTEMKKMILTK